MLNHEHTGLRHQYRNALLAQVRTQHYSHLTTLNTHRGCSIETALGYLKRWRIEMLRRLHGQKFYLLPAEQLTQYFGCPEMTREGHPHFHLLCLIPEGLVAKFERVSAERWKAIVPSGTHHIVRIGPTEEDQVKVLDYTTKNVDPNAAFPFVDSRLYQ